jgi:DNA-binding protein
MSEKDSEPDISNLVDQLKDATLVNKHIQKETNKSELVNPDNIEEFVVKNSSDLINQSLDVMNNVKDYIMASGDPDSISALSELIKASTGAIESLNKIVIQNKRTATSIATKSMDISSKHAIEDKRQEGALIGDREEILKRLLDEAKVIEVSDTSEETLSSSSHE